MVCAGGRERRGNEQGNRYLLSRDGNDRGRFRRSIIHSRRSLVYHYFLLLQVFTGKEPFDDLEPIVAVVAITQGRRPQRPTHPYATGKMWKLIQQCWDENPSKRPQVQEALGILLASLVSHPIWRPPVPRLDYILTSSNPPAWKQLINPDSPANERFDLIKSIFSDHDEVEVFKHFSGNDAQAFVDGIDKVAFSNLSPLRVRRSNPNKTSASGR